MPKRQDKQRSSQQELKDLVKIIKKAKLTNESIVRNNVVCGGNTNTSFRNFTNNQAANETPRMFHNDISVIKSTSVANINDLSC